MKILIAPDSFKESLSAQQAANTIARAFKAVIPQADLHLLPVADGGEGTTDALLAATHGRVFKQIVTGALGEARLAQWGILGGGGKTAVIETAAACGLDQVPIEKRNPWLTTTYGMGELIIAALDQGVRHIIIGLGGSATNDAGAGLLQALGVRLLDERGDPIPAGGGGLARLSHIDLSTMDARLQHIRFEVACDVDNPLIGPCGASAVFGPQKGADAQMVSALDENLAHFSAIIQQKTGKDIAHRPGAGAAGGLGAAFMGFLDADLKSGIDIVLDAIGFENHLHNADLVITGEGRVDSQTVHGKTPVGVSKRAQKYRVPVIALAGSVSNDADILYQHGIDALFSIVNSAMNLDTALKQAEGNLYQTAYNVARLWQLR